VTTTLELLGLDGVAVAAGSEQPISGKPVWMAGHEGDGWPERNTAIEIQDGRDDPGVLARLCGEEPVELIAIGPLTNVANALRTDPSFAQRVKCIHTMGGYFEGPRIEHNFLCDAVAAQEVFDSGIPIVVAGLEATMRSWYGEADVRRMAASADPVCNLLADQIRRWMEFSLALVGDSPHDTLPVLTVLEPEIFGLEPCRVSVEAAGGEAGRSVATPADGPHFRIADVDVEALQRKIYAGLETDRP
jgi:purine nucleosidase